MNFYGLCNLRHVIIFQLIKVNMKITTLYKCRRSQTIHRKPKDGVDESGDGKNMHVLLLTAYCEA